MAKKKKTRAADEAARQRAVHSSMTAAADTVPEKKIPALFIFAGAAWAAIIIASWITAPQFQQIKPSYFAYHFKYFFSCISLDFLSLLPKYLTQLALFSLLAASCHGIGRLALYFFKKDFSLPESLSYSFSIGIFILSSWMFLVSAFHMLYPAAAWIFICAGIASFAFSFKKQPITLSCPKKDFSYLGRLEITSLAALMMILFFSAIQSFTPEIFFDTLVYHLGVPNQWVAEHGFVPIKGNIYSNLFMFHGLAYTACLLTEYSYFLPRLLNTYAFFMSIAAIAGTAGRHFSKKTALWAAVIFCSFVLADSSTAYAGAESFTILFCAVSVSAALRALSENGSIVFFVLSGILAGCAMASKATCLVYGIGIMLMIMAYFKFRIKDCAKQLAFFVLSASLPVMPWIIKNIIYCGGNPFFPFAASVFGMPEGYSAEMISSFMQDTNPQTSFLSWLKNPWDLLRGNLQSGELLPPLCFIMLPSLPFLIKKDRKAMLVSVFVFVSWLLWSAVSSMPRFFLPALPVLAILTACALDYIPAAVPGKIFRLLCTVQIYFAFALFFSVLSNHDKFMVFFNVISESRYLSSVNSIYPLPIWKAINYANKNLPEDAKILFLGESRSFYLQRKYAASSVFNTNPLAEYAYKSENARDMYNRLRSDGFTHIIFNPGEGLRTNSYAQFSAEKTRNIMKSFFSEFLEIEWHENQKANNTVINTIFILKITDSPSGPVPPNYIEMALQKAENLKKAKNK